MHDTVTDLLPSEAEMAAGFAVQTLRYPAKYELPRLGCDTKIRLERAIALEFDVNNRVKRCRANDGYIHEVYVDGEWIEQQRFESFDEVVGSDIYRIFLRKNAEKDLEVEVND